MPSPIDDLTTPLLLLSGGIGLRDDRVGELLGQWASSSPWAHHQFLVAAKVISSSVHKEACKVAVAQYARCVLTPEAMVELVLIMRSPKNTLRQVSELISLLQLQYWCTVTQLNPDHYVELLCTGNAFDLKSQELLTPLQLDPPTSTTHPCATAVVWPLDSWIRYVFSRPALIRRVYKSFPLTFLVRGDRYPVSGSSWTQITISLANMGWLCRFFAAAWALRLANRHDKQMPTLGILWKCLFEVRKAATQWCNCCSNGVQTEAF